MAAWPMLMSLRRQYPHVALDKNHQKHPIKHPRTQFLSPLFCALAILFSFSIYQSFRADLKQSGSWGCEMSWMSPSYRRLEWIDFISTRYALYLYREQGWDSEDTVSYSAAGYSLRVSWTILRIVHSFRDTLFSLYLGMLAHTNRFARSPPQRPSSSMSK